MSDQREIGVSQGGLPHPFSESVDPTDEVRWIWVGGDAGSYEIVMIQGNPFEEEFVNVRIGAQHRATPRFTVKSREQLHRSQYPYVVRPARPSEGSPEPDVMAPPVIVINPG